MYVVQALVYLCKKALPKNCVQKLKDRLETLIVGDPLDKNTDIGAINSKDAIE
jgi:aldehyde dehydrogenase (NAD+)